MRRLIAVGTVILMALIGLSEPAGASGVLQIHLVGIFNGVASIGSVTGTQQGLSATGVKGQPFTFAVTCTTSSARGPVPAACGPVQYNFGDGVTRSGGARINHGYRTTGSFDVTASVSATGFAVGVITARVSPYYPDVRSGVAARAVWSLGTLGLNTTCTSSKFCPAPAKVNGPALVLTVSLAQASPAEASGLKVTSTNGIWVGQILTMSGQSTMVTAVAGNVVHISPGLTVSSARGASINLFPALAEPLVNGVTSQSCLANAAACGLPSKYFSTSNEAAPCRAKCVAALERDNYLVSSNPPQLVYNPTNCGDGYVAAKIVGGWQVNAGVEPGCVSRRAFLTQLVELTGGIRGHLAKSPCTDDHSALVRRAAAVGLMGPLANGGRCYLSNALTKGVAYELLGRIGGHHNARAAMGLLDIAHENLVGGVASSASVIGGLLANGTPLVGDTSCSSGRGLCFNPYETITHIEAAQLVSSALVSTARVSDGTSARLSAASPSYLIATVVGAVGEPLTAVHVTVSTAGGSCTSIQGISSGRAISVGCVVPTSRVPRIGRVTVSGGWGPATAVVVFG